ncbi:MAG: hypothetical protein GY805_36930 [Chloroflexi bacterium]|nr:hypothetical protein [Chloroflexota bacterium]
MLLKEQLKAEIDGLDERYLELLYKITRQFPRIAKRPQGAEQTRLVATLFQEIADSGGLGIKNPDAWQREIRKDRPLPFRGT